MLITISHDRHFLNAICTHIADIDYETIITYTGGYDDMVMAKSQVRGRVEQENAERKKKIAQLQDFVARFGAGTRASQVQSRKKQIEKLQLADLKKSNIERPFIQFLVKKPSGKQTLTLDGLSQALARASTVCEGFTRAGHQGREDRHHRRERRRQDHALPHAGGRARARRRQDRRGATRSSVGYLAQDHRDRHPQRAPPSTDWLHSFDDTRRTCRTSAACSARCSSRAKRGRSRPTRSPAAKRCASSSPS